MENLTSYKPLQGGLKNLHSTSFVNCILQIFLHYQQFIDSFSLPEMIHNDLFPPFQTLFDRLNQTNCLASADSILSYFKVDPSHPENDKFLEDFLAQIPFEIDHIFNQENSDIIDQICAEPVLKDFIFISINTSKNQFNVKKEIQIFNKTFFLYAIVQGIESQSKETSHFFVTLRDNQGYVRYNDTAVNVISEQDLFQNHLHQQLTPIKCLVYINDLSAVKIYRHPLNISQIETFLSQPVTINRPETPTFPYFSAQNSQNPQFETPSCQIGGYFAQYFNARKMTIVSKINDYQIPKRIGLNSFERVKNQIQDAEGLPIRYVQQDKTITFSLSNYRDIDVNTVLQTASSKFTFWTSRRAIFTGIFAIQQKVRDIKHFVHVYFQRILRTIESYVIYIYANSHHFLLPDDSIEIQKLLEYGLESFFIDIEDEGPLSLLNIPIYSTRYHFFQVEIDPEPVCIDMTLDDYLSYLTNKTNLNDLVLMQYKDEDYSFIILSEKEYIVKLANLPNLRIQDSDQFNGTVFFYNNIPFTFPIEPNNNVSNLVKSIAAYLNLQMIHDDVSISFKDEDQNDVKIDPNTPILENSGNLIKYGVVKNMFELIQRRSFNDHALF